MDKEKSLVSNAFQTFMKEAPNHAQAWGKMIQELSAASALDKKTSDLAYLAVLSALQLTSGIPFHVKSAQASGATKEEIISALLIGLPAAGHKVTQSLPIAIEALESK